MAELVLGVAKSAVDGTLSRVKLAIEEERKLKVMVQQDLVFITGEFQMMQSFLNVANAERARNEVVRTWVRQVRDLAYDVEDCVEFVAHLDKKSIWTWLWRVVPSCMAPALPLDEAIAEIKQLKTRVEDVSQRNMRYSLISDSGSKPVSQTNQLAAAAGAAAFDFRSEARKVARSKHGLKHLIRLLLDIEDSERLVIVVLGTGGDPWTTTNSTIREAYGYHEICRDFTCRAWVKLMDPFDPDEFLRSLLTQFYASSSQVEQGANTGVHVRTRMKAATEDDLMEEFMQQVSQQRYLIVLEDLSTVVQWDAIMTFLPESTKGSRIVVSTQQLWIARLCIETEQSWQASELQQSASDDSVFAVYKAPPDDDSEDERKDWRRIRKKMDEARKFLGPENLVGVIPYDDLLELVDCEVSTGFKFVWHPSLVDELAGLIGRGPQGSVLSVWGIAGVGKSTLVRGAYYKDMLKTGAARDRERSLPYGWVHVSHPFDLTEFSWRLISADDLYALQAMEVVATGLMDLDPIHECRNLLSRNRIFVIDGLQSVEEWDLIKAGLLSESTRAIIIVITTEVSLAIHCAGSERAVFNVRCLDTGKALELFKQIYDTAKYQVTEDEVELIVNKCGGLPKVLTVVSSYMSKGRDAWTDLRANFMGELETNPSFDSLRDLFAWMRAYFDTCPDFLKPCIFYLSVFPADHSTRRRRLLRRWIAEGYCRDIHGSTAEENGEKFFSMLVNLSIIQLSPPAGSSLLTRYGEVMVQYHVNGFFHEYIISRPMEDNLVFVLDGHCKHNSERVGHHLTIRSSWDRDVNVFKAIDFSRLRSLTVFGKWESFFISASMKLLRVLDLEGTSGVKDDDLKPIGKLLPRLKFFSLRGCIEISRLPSSLGCLKQLQTLDITNTSIVTLPPTIVKLQKLQYIRASNAGRSSDDSRDTSTAANQPAADDTLASCLSKILTCRLVGAHNGGVQVPAGIGNLMVLHTLGVVDVSAAGGRGILKELKNITQLHKLGVSGINRENIQQFRSAISGHHHLESLTVRLDKDNELGILDIMLPPKNLQSLKLYGSVGKLPAVWIRQLQNLRKLTLKMTMLAEEDKEVFQHLPNLVILRIFVNKVQEGELSFPRTYMDSVLVLEVACKTNLLVVISKHIMFKLEVLKLHWSSGSSLRFSGLQRLQSLNEVSLEGSRRAMDSGNTLSFLSATEELQRELAEHPKKPILKLE